MAEILVGENVHFHISNYDAGHVRVVVSPSSRPASLGINRGNQQRHFSPKLMNKMFRVGPVFVGRVGLPETHIFFCLAYAQVARELKVTFYLFSEKRMSIYIVIYFLMFRSIPEVCIVESTIT